MKAVANLRNLHCEEGKKVIVRNLSRILDIRIIDIDVENGMLHFLYIDSIGLHRVKQELSRIGFPVQSCKTPTSTPSMYGSGAMSSPAF